MREPKDVKTDVDFTVPINKAAIKLDGCFGKEWDVATKECKVCAERDLCGIIFKDVVDAKANEQEEKLGSLFLDKSDFRFTDIQMQELFDWVKSGETATNEFVIKVMQMANSSDQTAGIEATKRIISEHELLYSKSGKVWKR